MHRPLSFASVAAALATLLAPAGAATQQPSFGPLTFEEGSPLQRLAFTASVEGADVVGAGVWGIDLYNGYANIFEQDSTATHVLFLDMERLTTAITVRHGVSPTLEFGGRLTFETTGPGHLDGFILGWHERFGFGNANRDRFPQDAYRQWLTDGNDVYLSKPEQTFGLRDVRGYAKWRAWASVDGRSVLSLRSVLRLPTDAPVDGDGNTSRIDGSVMAHWRAGMGSWYAHGMLGASFTPPSARLDPILHRSTRFLALAVERSLGSSLAAIVQVQAQSAALRSFEHRELDRAPTNLLVGLAGRLGETWTWDASFQEDVPADTPAVDFTITLRVGRRW